MTTTLGLRATPKPNAICMDISLLQAADTFLHPPQNGSDPRSPLCFAQVATAFCNGANLYVPLPSSDQGEPPHLLAFWRKRRGVDFLPHSELRDQELACYGDLLTTAFVAYAEQNAQELAAWLRFQYSPDINEQYINRAGNHPIELATEYVIPLRIARRLPNLEAAIQAHVGTTLPRAFDAYRPFQADPVRTSICYLFSVFARGLSYAERCAQLGTSVPYSRIWFRNRAVQLGGGPDPSIEERHWYPWGLVLSQLFDPADNITSRSRTRVQETLLAIREDVEAGRFNPTACAADGGVADHGDPNNSPIVVAALKTLTRAGITFSYANSKREEILRTLLLGTAVVASMLSPAHRLAPAYAGLGIALLNLAKPKIANMEARLQLHFAADTFWDVFERDKKLLSALSEAAAAWRTSRHTQ